MASTVRDRLDEQEALLAQWLEARRQVAVWEARAADVLARRAASAEADIAASPVHRDAIRRSMVAEFSAAGRLAKGTVEQSFADAQAIAEFPGVGEAFTAGEVSVAHVREVLRAARPLTQAIRDGVIDDSVRELFDAAAVEITTTQAPARARTHLRELAAALAPDTVTDGPKGTLPKNQAPRPPMISRRRSATPIPCYSADIQKNLPRHRRGSSGGHPT